MGNAVHEDGVDIEPEAKRRHQRTVTPLAAREQERPDGRYFAGEAGVAAASR
jgi:hypothetical protein